MDLEKAWKAYAKADPLYMEIPAGSGPSLDISEHAEAAFRAGWNAKTFDVEAWLNETIERPSKIQGLARKIPRYERICFLVGANGGFKVNQIGVRGKGPTGHQVGLDIEDAVELIHYHGFVAGLDALSVDWKPIFEQYFARYVAKMQLMNGMPKGSA